MARKALDTNIINDETKDSVLQTYHDTWLYGLTNGGVSGKVAKTAIETGPGYSCGVSELTTAGKMLEIKTLRIYSDRALSFTISLNRSSAFQNNVAIITSIPGQIVEVPINMILRPGFSLLIFANKWFDENLTDAVINTSFIGTTRTDEVIVDANFDIQWIGDSILSGTGYSKTEASYPFLTRKYLRTLEVDCKNTIKATPGLSTLEYAPLAENYSLLNPNAKLFCICLGTNDSSSGRNYSPTVFKERLKIMVDSLLTQRGFDSEVILITAPPVEDNDWEIRASALRTAADELASTYSSRVYSINLTSSYSRNDISNYHTADTAGLRIHPSEKAHLEIFNNKIKPFFQSNPNLIEKLKKLN